MPSSRSTARIGFRALNAADLGMLAQWLADPRNSAHWGGSGETDALEDHLTDHRVAQWIVTRDGTDVAYIQDYDIHAYQDHPLAALPKGARGIDTFIGQSSWMGAGLGPSYLALHVQCLFDSDVPALGIDPDNVRSHDLAARLEATIDPMAPPPYLPDVVTYRVRTAGSV
ncbi:GNAT family N-acetyltransferase [Marivita sp.]|uniref:GNAT family N-acetyltransferase n=1 Tax=Marivita sp. TaxID=2003365 RepID=UPI0025C3D45F|nr:GNAT family N-acetyltransferase [Marivita sp.]